MTSLIGASSIIFWSSKVLGADGGCGLKAVNPIPTSPILVNGCPRGKIWALRGIGQGTSLSHFLFPIVADSFSHFVNIWRNKDLIEGFIVGQDSIHISHVQYADDTLFLFFFFAKERNVFAENWLLLLHLFEKASDLSINMQKSTVVGVHMEDALVEEVARIY